MPISTEWYDSQKTIIIYHVENEWQINDLNLMAHHVAEMLAGVEGKVDLIANFLKAGPPPNNLLLAVRQLTTNQPPQFRIVVAVGVNRYIEILLEILRRVYPDKLSNILSAPSIEEAHRIIIDNQNKIKG